MPVEALKCPGKFVVQQHEQCAEDGENATVMAKKYIGVNF